MKNTAAVEAVAGTVLLLVALACAGNAPALDQPAPTTQGIEWTQWRGPSRDGSVATDARPGSWPERPVKVWERDVGGGYSGPVVAGDRVWLHSRTGESEIVSSLTLSRGDTVWSQRYDAPFEQHSSASGHGDGPYATPALVDGRLFTFGVTAILSAWNAGSGVLLWRKDYSAEFASGHETFGNASSPLVWEGLCFVHVGGAGWEQQRARGNGPMVALDVIDGRERWRWSGDGPPVGASPVMRVIDGRHQLVFKSLENIVALDPLTGQELWRIPYRVPQDNTIVTPLFVGNQLVTSDWDMGLHAWRIALQGETWGARKAWETRAASMFTSSPVAVGVEDAGSGDALVVGFSHFNSGQLFGLDPVAGEVLWRGPRRSGEHVSLIAWGRELLVFQEDGSMVVGTVSREGFRPLRTYELGRSGTWAHPAIAGNRIIIRDGDRLAVFRFDHQG